MRALHFLKRIVRVQVYLVIASVCDKQMHTRTYVHLPSFKILDLMKVLPLYTYNYKDLLLSNFQTNTTININDVQVCDCSVYICILYQTYMYIHTYMHAQCTVTCVCI